MEFCMYQGWNVKQLNATANVLETLQENSSGDIYRLSKCDTFLKSPKNEIKWNEVCLLSSEILIFESNLNYNCIVKEKVFVNPPSEIRYHEN